MEKFLQQFITGNYSFLLMVRTPDEVLAWMVAILMLSFVVISVVVRRNKQRIRYMALSCTIVYIVFLVCHTLIYRNPKPELEYELIPFWSYYDVIVKGKFVFLYENIFNVVLFIPIGFFLGVYMINNNWSKMLLTGMSLSAFIELAQLIFHRGLCEFDDVFHNILGSLLGYGIYLAIIKFFWKSKNHGDKELRSGLRDI